MILLFAALALAAPPEGLRPGLSPWDAPEQFAQWMKSQGAAGASLACTDPWPEHAKLCFRLWEKEKRRYVTQADAATWGSDAAGLQAAVLERSRGKIAGMLERTPVEGLPAHYWIARDGDGWQASGILHPDELADAIGGVPILVAAPADGVLLAWRPGVEGVDKAMAVGVREMHDQLDGSITPVIHRWDGTAWAVWGKAVAAE